ncbi:Fe-S-containing hydro-lyase [Halanaerobacter jeridensis]|uniref:Fumarate hydratase subunit beta n=1 Tax=Halanaerobacter jeridensis TaxID=706427 RepID=A0A938XR75_9FIRM|nr:Fe-S-containing hydro-lyase [Halanaerobacter jeridensis]MBM7556141.1 fumarate hydratase subunit beta [Halanaerobacter jeridensis]
MAEIKLETPVTESEIRNLKAGDKIKLSGVVYTARDAAHERLIEALNQGRDLPFDMQGAALYYVGPAPAKPGEVIGSAGPTTSYRMDPFTPQLLKNGLKIMIGKGNRNQKVMDTMKEEGAVYLAATGGAAALISERIKEMKVIAYPDLGTEAVRKLRVKNLPLVCVIDSTGKNLYNR